MIARRRFISILGGAGLASALSGPADAVTALTKRHWRGIALGADASILLAHENAAELIRMARAEISRLESIFSLYRPASDLTRLNAVGFLSNPPFELVELLSHCDALHRRSFGAFDPTVQSLWAAYAQAVSSGREPTEAEIGSALDRTGWWNVSYSPDEVDLSQNGIQVSLNGIAQGYITDKVAELFRANGVSDVLINLGEIATMGRQSDGSPWRVSTLDTRTARLGKRSHELRNAAIATSVPLGTAFDKAGTIGHIIDPRTGRPAARWHQVTVIAPNATWADGLSTALCMLNEGKARIAAAGLEVDLLAP